MDSWDSATAADCKLLSVPPSSILEPGGLRDPSILTVHIDPPFLLPNTYFKCFTLAVSPSQCILPNIFMCKAATDDCFFLGGFANVYICPRKMVVTYYVWGGQQNQVILCTLS